MPLDLTKMPSGTPVRLDFSRIGKIDSALFPDADTNIVGGKTVADQLRELFDSATPGFDERNGMIRPPAPEPASSTAVIGATQEGATPSPVVGPGSEPAKMPEGMGGLSALLGGRAERSEGGVLGAAQNVAISLEDAALGVLALPSMLYEDPAGTAEAIVKYAPRQFKLLLDADLLNLNEVSAPPGSSEHEQWKQMRDAARDELYKDPLGPIFAFQMTKAVAQMGTAAPRLIKDMRDARRVVAKETAEAMLERTVPDEAVGGQSPPAAEKISDVTKRIESRGKIVPESQAEPIPPLKDMPSVDWWQRFVMGLPRNPAERAAQEAVLARAGELQHRRYVLGEFVKESQKRFTKDELAAMRFYREKTVDPKTGVAPELSETARKFVDEEIAPRLDKTFQELVDAGMLDESTKIDNFISHFWTGSAKQKTAFGKLVMRARQGRKIPTYAEGIKIGLKPFHKNIIEDLAAYEELSTRVIVNNDLVRTLWGTFDTDGNPMLAPLTKKNRGLLDEGWKIVDNKALNKALYVARKGKSGKTVVTQTYPATLVHPDFVKPVNSVFADPFTSNWYRNLRTVNAATKAINLSVSLFHPWALAESALGIGPAAPFIGPGRGLKALKDPAFVEEMIKQGHVDFGPSVDVGRNIVRDGLLKIEARAAGKPVVAQAATFLRAFKDGWDRALWDTYQHGLKAYAYQHFKAKLTKRFPDVHPKIIMEEAGKLVNNSFGGQNWEAMMTNPRILEASHALLLAPDWTLSNIKQAINPLESRATGWAKGKLAKADPIAMQESMTRSKLRGYAGRRYWGKFALFNFLGLQMMNYAFSGMRDDMEAHFTWDNPEGQKLNFVTPFDNEDGVPEYAVSGKQWKEIMRWATEPAVQLGSKAAPTLRMAAEQATGHALGSGFPAPWVQDKESGIRPTFWESVPQRASHAVQYFVPFSFRSNNFALTFPVTQGMTKDRFLQMYTRAMQDDDIGQMDRLIMSAQMNDLDYLPLVRMARSRVKRDEKAEMEDE